MCEQENITVTEELFDSVCDELGIHYEKTIGKGVMYIKQEDGSYRKLTDEDSEDAFGFLKESCDE